MKTIIKIVILLFIIPSCKKENIDLIAPSEVSNLNASYSDSKIIITWSDPIDKDLCKIEITFEGVSIEVAKGIQYKEIDNLEIGKNYTFTLKTIDENGNKSEGIQIQCKIDYRLQFTGKFTFLSYYWCSSWGETCYYDTLIYIGSVSIISYSDSLIKIRYRAGNQTTICGEDSVFGAYIEPHINAFGVLSYSRVLRCSNQSYFYGIYKHIDSIRISIGSGGLGMQYGQYITGIRIK